MLEKNTKRSAILATSLLSLAAFGCKTAQSEESEIQAQVRETTSIERDERAVPRILAQNFSDALTAQGFVHAQDRLFQMDLIRMKASGRLSEYVGPVGLSSDKEYRTLNFKKEAEEIVASLPEDQLKYLSAYVRGVNAGMQNLESAPFEYGLLGTQPDPWTEADSALVLLYMFHDLNFSASRERSLGTLQETLPEELVQFLTPNRSRFDAPIIDDPEPYSPMPIPAAEVVNLRNSESSGDARLVDPQTNSGKGSNNWVVSGDRSVHGSAIMANDTHLQLSAPGIWHRAEFHFDDNFLGGVGIPGLPGIIVGSNKNVSWGVTNAYGDFQDLVVVEPDESNPSRYKTPSGTEPFTTRREEIKVRGSADKVIHEVTETIWGPVSDKSHTGKPMVLKWTALEQGGADFSLFAMKDAKNVEDAIEVAKRWNGPSQNVVIGDSEGNIGWTLSGAYPKRVDVSGRTPSSWLQYGQGWDGMLSPDEKPEIINPPSGAIFTANSRPLPMSQTQSLGFTYSYPSRSYRIREMLGAQERFSEQDMLRMQLDDRVTSLDFYQKLIEGINVEPDSLLTQAKEIVADWDGTADAAQTAPRILDRFRTALNGTVLSPLIEPCKEVDSSFRYIWPLAEESAMRLLEEQPEHFLPQRFESWEQLTESVFRYTVEQVAADGGERGLLASWGEIDNLANIKHPLADFAGDLADKLRMPREPLSGHRDAVNAQRTSQGASMRVIVSPGLEEHGVIQIPGGQSGDPFSVHFRDHHRDWVRGEGGRFLAGETVRITPLPPQ